MTTPSNPVTQPRSSDTRTTRVRVPGKVILSGEHAVVYGTPALACAINKYAFASVIHNSTAGIHLTVPEFGIDQHYSSAQLLDIAQQTQSRHQQFLTAAMPLSSVVASPEAFFAAALGASGMVSLLNDQQGLTIELTMDLVAGGGMGSSAALVAAMLASVFKHLGQPLTDKQLITKTTQSEHWQHGRSSGLDPYVCIMGGLQQFQQGSGSLCPSNTFDHCYLVTTGRPLSSTGECVEAVRDRVLPASFWQQFETLQTKLLKDIQQGNISAMTSTIASNHGLLQYIGVVPAAVAHFIDKVESIGGAAKICGAGSVLGDAGGLVFALGLELEQMQKLCNDHGYGVEAMLADIAGVTYLD